MTEQPLKTDPQLNWMGFQKAAGDWQGFKQLTKGQRTMLGWGGTLLGLGAGSCLAFAIYIFEKAHPLEVINSQGL